MAIEKMTEVPYPGLVPWLAVRKKINEIIEEGTGGEAAWGSITGDLEDQTDLATALAGKADTTDLPAEGELVPDTTGASQGDVLTVGASGPEWATPAGGSEKSIIVRGRGQSGFIYDGTTYTDLKSLALAVKDGNATPGIVIADDAYALLTAIPPMILPDTGSGTINVACIVRGGYSSRYATVTYNTSDGELTSFNLSYSSTGWMTARTYLGTSAPVVMYAGDLWFNASTKTLSLYDGTTWQTLFTPSS